MSHLPSSPTLHQQLHTSSFSQTEWKQLQNLKADQVAFGDVGVFDIAFKLPQLTTLIKESTILHREKISKWEKANQMSLLIMQTVIEEHIRKVFQHVIWQRSIWPRYRRNSKSLTRLKVGMGIMDQESRPNPN
ncbi:unnamed protein product [Malus baccata var. baccata]